MKSFTSCIQLMKQNWKSLFLFEVLFKAVSSVVFVPVLIALFNAALKLSGILYLSDENVYQFLKSPFTIIVVVILAIIATMIALIEISAIIQCLHASYYRQKISVVEMCYAGFNVSLKLIKRNNFLMIVFVLFIIPLTNFTLASGLLSSLKVPEFIMSYINNNTILRVSFITGMLLLAYLTVRWLFSIHSFAIHSSNFKQAHIESTKLVKGQYLKTIILLTAWLSIITLLMVFAIFAGTAVISLIGNLLHRLSMPYTAMLGAISIFVAVLLFIYSIVSLPITVSFISSLYYENLQRLNIEISPYSPSAAGKTRLSKLINIVLIVAIAINLAYVFVGYIFVDEIPISQLQPITVTAHRGDSVKAPENTMPAFVSAVESMADYIELDVSQTKDGVLIITHDSNLKRISAVDKNIWDVTYDEIKNLDVGTWFSDEFSGTKICTLQEAIDFAKGKVKLHIELKPTGKETDFVKSVVDLIVQNKFEDQCILASLDFETVKEIKDYNPDIKLAYITAVAYGDLPKLADIDVFSVESTFITKTMVNKVHSSGKEICAWTVNSADGIKKMISLGVNSIITDDPALAKELIYSNKINEDLLKYIEFISGYRHEAE